MLNFKVTRRKKIRRAAVSSDPVTLYWLITAAHNGCSQPEEKKQIYELLKAIENYAYPSFKAPEGGYDQDFEYRD